MGTRRLPLVAWTFLSIGTVILLIGVTGVIKEIKLAHSGDITRADVTDWRVHHGKYGVIFDVRYAFRVEHKTKLYTVSDYVFPLTRENLWASIPKELWEDTKNTHILKVSFLPDSPEVNRPEASSHLGDAVAGVLVGILSCFMGFVFIRAARRGWLS